MTQRTILVAVGQLPQDIVVLTRAAQVASTSRAQLQVVHVLDLPGANADLGDVTTFLGQAALATRDRIEVALGELGLDLSQTEIRIELGPHAITLIELCDALSPDLIVMRAHQKTKIKEKILGSTTDRVIAAAKTPVLVIKRKAGKPYDTVVVATNGTDNVLEALAFVSGLLSEIGLSLVQAVQIPTQLKEAMLRVGSPTAELDELRNKLENEAKAHLRTLAGKSGRQAKTKVLKGDPAKVLTRMCRDHDVDLMVLGQGRAGLVRRAFIGSVSRRLLRNANCDLMIWSPGRDVGD